jgi:DNA-binding MarR family transcriptional regulator
VSREAETWAWSIPDLKPAQKLVLVCLANCHTPTMGCFPSQDYISKSCNISRSSVNNHLAALEALGFFSRVLSVNEITRKRERTLYLLAFDNQLTSGKLPPHVQILDTAFDGDNSVDNTVDNVDGQAEPCPKTMSKNHVQNLDMNLKKDNNKTLSRKRGRVTGLVVDYISPWTGDPAVRQRVTEDLRYGESFARSYIDTARTDPSGALVAFSWPAFNKLRSCAALSGIRVKPP